VQRTRLPGGAVPLEAGHGEVPIALDSPAHAVCPTTSVAASEGERSHEQSLAPLDGVTQLGGEEPFTLQLHDHFPNDLPALRNYGVSEGGKLFGDRSVICLLGRDTHPGGNPMSASTKRGFRAAGCDVVGPSGGVSALGWESMASDSVVPE
jgi:hypothetical protein